MLQLQIEDNIWKPIIEITQGAVLERTAKDKWYKATIAETRMIRSRFGCYTWMTEDKIRYCGSFAKDYKYGSKPNFAARISRYLGTHKGTINVRIHQEINLALQHSPVILAHFVFDKLILDNIEISFEDYSEDSNLIRMVEELLICTYRRENQCDWNRS